MELLTCKERHEAFVHKTLPPFPNTGTALATSDVRERLLLEAHPHPEPLLRWQDRLPAGLKAAADGTSLSNAVLVREMTAGMREAMAKRQRFQKDHVVVYDCVDPNVAQLSPAKYRRFKQDRKERTLDRVRLARPRRASHRDHRHPGCSSPSPPTPSHHLIRREQSSAAPSSRGCN